MNREFLLEAVAGASLGLFAALALAWTAIPRDSDSKPRGVLVAGLVYGLIAIPVVVGAGLDLLNLVLVASLLLLPVLSARLGARPASGVPHPPVARVASTLVAVGLLSVVLIAAGQTLSLFGRLDPRAGILLVAGAALAVVIIAGAHGAGRVGFWAALALLVPLLVVIALAALLGSPDDLVAPVILVAGPTAAQWLALAVAFIALGRADPGLRALGTGPALESVFTFIAAMLAMVLAFGVAMLVLLGGSTLGPSLQLFTVPANLDAVPGPMLIVVAVLALLFIAMAAAVLAGPAGPPSSRPELAVVVGAAAAIAIAGPGLERVAIVTAVLAASLVVVPRTGAGLAVGLGAAAVASAVLAVAGELRFGWAAAGAIVLVAVVSAVAGSVTARDSQQVEPADLP